MTFHEFARLEDLLERAWDDPEQLRLLCALHRERLARARLAVGLRTTPRRAPGPRVSAVEGRAAPLGPLGLARPGCRASLPLLGGLAGRSYNEINEPEISLFRYIAAV